MTPMFKPLLTVLVLLLLLPGASCKRKGCTDTDAKNHDPKAKKNDFSCLYEASAVIWYGKEYAGQLQLEGATSLKYYVEDQLVGSTATDVYFTGPPACGQEGSITVTKELGEAKGRSYEYRVEDQLGRVHKEGILQFDAGQCKQVELTF